MTLALLYLQEQVPGARSICIGSCANFRPPTFAVRFHPTETPIPGASADAQVGPRLPLGEREPARRPDTAGPLAVATPTTRRLADASLSRNTRRAYLGALARLDAWRGTAPVDDASLGVYLGELFEAGRAPATAALAVRFRAKLAGQPAPAGEATARVLGGYRRTAADRGRGQAAPLRAAGLAAILATAARPRTDGRGVESHTTAQRRGRLDAVIAGLLFMGGLRRSEVAAVRWADVTACCSPTGHRSVRTLAGRGGPARHPPRGREIMWLSRRRDASLRARPSRPARGPRSACLQCAGGRPPPAR